METIKPGTVTASEPVDLETRPRCEKHDWNRSIHPIHLTDLGRECIECGLKQKLVDGEWQDIN